MANGNEVEHVRSNDDGLMSAVLSRCGTYRFELTRSLSRYVTKHKTVMWLMNNPSTADHKVDDPTIRRCKAFTAMWGCTRLTVGNVNPHRATDPKKAERPSIDTLTVNDRHLLALAEDAIIIVCGWGAAADPLLVARAYRVLEPKYAKKITALELTKNGSPKHPLYIKGTTRPVRIQPDPAKLDQWGYDTPIEEVEL